MRLFAPIPLNDLKIKTQHSQLLTMISCIHSAAWTRIRYSVLPPLCIEDCSDEATEAVKLRVGQNDRVTNPNDESSWSVKALKVKDRKREIAG